MEEALILIWSRGQGDQGLPNSFFQALMSDWQNFPFKPWCLIGLPAYLEIQISHSCNKSDSRVMIRLPMWPGVDRFESSNNLSA